MPDPTSLRVAPDTVVEVQDGEAFLLHLPSRHYYSLNRTGVVVWEAIRDGAEPVEALAAAHPDVPVDRLQADCEGLVDSLVRAGLLVTADGS